MVVSASSLLTGTALLPYIPITSMVKAVADPQTESQTMVPQFAGVFSMARKRGVR